MFRFVYFPSNYMCFAHDACMETSMKEASYLAIRMFTHCSHWWCSYVWKWQHERSSQSSSRIIVYLQGHQGVVYANASTSGEQVRLNVS